MEVSTHNLPQFSLKGFSQIHTSTAIQGLFISFLIVAKGLVCSLLANRIRLGPQVQRLDIVGLHIQDKFQAVLGLLLLIHANVTARAQQIAIFHRSINGRQVIL